MHESVMYRGKLLKRPKTGPVLVVADGRGDWIGWLEIKTERVNAVATQNTARVIREINSDVLASIEVDIASRSSDSMTRCCRIWQLGHASIQITVDTYGHLIPGANRGAVDRLDDAPTQLAATQAQPEPLDATSRSINVKK